MKTQTQVRELMDMSVTDTHGSKVGTVKQVYLNDDSGAPEWVTVHTGWFGMRESFVPLSGARKSGETLQVPYDKDTIKGAPNVDADEHLSHAQIVDLYRHYGVRPPAPSGRGPSDSGRPSDSARRDADTRSRSGTATGTGGAAGMAGTPGLAGRSGGKGVLEGGDPSARQAQPQSRPGKHAATGLPPRADREGHEDTEVTRSEERLRIGTERHEAGRVHVHKWIETETVEQTIPVSHEELRIDREPIVGGRPASGVTVAEDDLEIILYEERPIVAKETVPVERIRLHTEEIRDEQTVRDQLRKERVEVTRDDGSRGPRR
ncbi:DUF2382 domain-containing protein [Spirillospora albida]|uniref:DUF2382 domain-containing protein n=1 Tax=Spirillospora albida TaxID=58123 RepID=UPI0004BE8D39|nr:PRC and DUF2382 domain-containing protein [Spirillospora albida]